MHGVFMIETRDGIKLASDAYLPRDGIQREATPRPRPTRPSKAAAQLTSHIDHQGWYSPYGERHPRMFHHAATADGPATRIHQLRGVGPAEETKVVKWTHYPNSPVPATHDIESLWYLLAAYPDERAQAERPDLITFRTESTLEDDLVLVGEPIFTAKIDFPAATTHIFLKLQDVF